MNTAPKKLGLIGLDTSHVEAFTKLLMDPNDPHFIPGCQIVAAYPGGSPDFERSRSRVKGFTSILRDQYHVATVDSPEAVAEQVDLVLMTAVDGRAHRDLFKRIAPYGRPVFVDKPFATTSQDAQAILDLAQASAAPVMSCSSMRYADIFQEALAQDSAEHGALVGIDCYGPMMIEPTQPGYFWYGVHCFEIMVAALGSGCVCVQTMKNKGTDLVTAQWADGRMASYRGSRCGPGTFGVTLHREKSARYLDLTQTHKPAYASMLEAILRSLPEGRSDVPTDQMLEVVRLIEAANLSRESGLSQSLSPPITA